MRQCLHRFVRLRWLDGKLCGVKRSRPQQHHLSLRLSSGTTDTSSPPPPQVKTDSRPCADQPLRIQLPVRDDGEESVNWLVNPKLAPHVFSLIPSPTDALHEYHTSVKSFRTYHTDLSVCFLGSGAGSPTRHRSSTATALRCGKNGTYVFDAGEGTLLQAIATGNKVALGNIRKIFITHMHGDHVLGIVSLLLSIQDACRLMKDKDATIKIYGPVGLYTFIAANLSLCYANLNHITVEVYELTGGTRRWLHPAALNTFREFRHRALIRKSIAPNADGTWTLERGLEIEKEQDSIDLGNVPRGFHVHAAQINHVPKLQCFGYVVQEPLSQYGRIDMEKAKALGLKPSKKLKKLQAGFAVMNDAEPPQLVHAHQVTKPGYRARKVAILGDCNGVPLPMAQLCYDADVLVHEATLLEDDAGAKVELGGHSTAGMAGQFADYVGARVLALNHISPGISGSEELERRLIDEAKKSLRRSTTVQLAYDMMEIMVPLGGFSREAGQ